MLNINVIKKSKNLYKHYRIGNKIAQTKHYPPANKEWFNSIYAYNKNRIKLLPAADKVTLKFLKSYFNLHSPKLEKSVKLSNIRRRKLKNRLRRLSTNRILISRAELKHTSNKVVITVYVYNRQEIYYFRKLQLQYIEAEYLDLKKTKTKASSIITKVYKQRKKLFKTLKINNHSYKKYENTYLKSLFSKCLQIEKIFFYYRQIISLNEYKFKKTYLLPLTALMKNIYNKEIEFNLVNLKHFNLNSSIFSETLLTKIKNKKNKVFRVLKASIDMFQLPPFNNLAVFDDMYNRKKKIQNLKVNYIRLGKQIKGDEINKITQEVYKKKSLNVMQDDSELIESKTNSVLNSLKNKSITGLRIEAAGRLTRRYTAQRSIYKLRYKGNLKNMDSSYKGLSSVLLRGHAKSNVQCTKLKSKLRIGSFGLKG